MADDTPRRQALQFALAIASEIEDCFAECDLEEATTDILAAADMIRQWLQMPEAAARLVMNVGPVTEQN